jgi:hypothetical protein
MLHIPASDAEFREWLDANPDGYFINCDHVPSPGYLKLHRASCWSVRVENWANHAGGDYLKVCGVDHTELESWAKRSGGKPLTPCGHCLR